MYPSWDVKWRSEEHCSNNIAEEERRNCHWRVEHEYPELAEYFKLANCLCTLILYET